MLSDWTFEDPKWVLAKLEKLPSYYNSGWVRHDPAHPRAVSGARLGVRTWGRHSRHVVSPSWDQIGKLGAVAVIRTGLNCFLNHGNEAKRISPRIRSLSPRPVCWWSKGLPR